MASEGYRLEGKRLEQLQDLVRTVEEHSYDFSWMRGVDPRVASDLQAVVGTEELLRVESEGLLAGEDARSYARSICSTMGGVLYALSFEQSCDLISIVRAAVVHGYEAGARDAASGALSHEGLQAIADSVEREEREGAALRAFHDELWAAGRAL